MKPMKASSENTASDIFTRYPCPNCKTEYIYYTPADISDEELLSKYGFRRKPSGKLMSVTLAYCTNEECNALSVGYIDKNSDSRSAEVVKSVTKAFLDNILKHKRRIFRKKSNKIIDLSTLGFKLRNNDPSAILHYCTDSRVILLGYGNIHKNGIINFSECISEVNQTLLKNLSLLLKVS